MSKKQPLNEVTQTSALPGWFADPNDNSRLRWWDGVAWTDHYSENEQAVDKKITFFNAKSVAKELQNRTAELTRALSEKEAEVFNRSQQIEALNTFIKNENLSDVYEATKRLQDLQFQEQELDKTLQEKLNLKEARARLMKVEMEHTALEELIEKRTAIAQNLETKIEQEEKNLLDIRANNLAQDLGLFDYKNPAEDSVHLSTKLASVRSDIKSMVTRKSAVETTENFTFNGSAAQGKKFVNNMSKIMLRAYNAEAENAVKAARAGNLEVIQKRIERVRDQITKQGTMIELEISSEYHKLRLEELSLAVHHLEAVKRAKEQEREEKAWLREEQKVERELAAEKTKLEKELTHYKNLRDALKESGRTEELDEIEDRIDEINDSIENVDYRAANVRAGYVYVVSNIGSFGEQVVKIGLTRRLEPMDRVKELGDASVPFKFDVHALSFHEDAVGLEKKLHRAFEHKRVNAVNKRKEFFNVSPTEVLEVLKKDADANVIDFVLEPEAEEYRLSTTRV